MPLTDGVACCGDAGEDDAYDKIRAAQFEELPSARAKLESRCEILDAEAELMRDYVGGTPCWGETA